MVVIKTIYTRIEAWEGTNDLFEPRSPANFETIPAWICRELKSQKRKTVSECTQPMDYYYDY